MTLNEVLDEIPMGMGAIARAIVTAKVPDLAAILDEPLEAVSVEFTGSREPLRISMADLEGENVPSTDNRPCPEVDRPRVLGHPLLGSQQGML